MSDTVSPFSMLPPIKSLGEAEKFIFDSHFKQLRSASFQKAVALSAPDEDDPELDGAPSKKDLYQFLTDWTAESQQQIDKAKSAYAAKESPAQPNWNVVLMSLFTACATYLRDTKAVRDAATVKDLEVAKAAHVKSVEEITNLAKSWGLKFEVLCDLIGDSPDGHRHEIGPYCCAFYSPAPLSPFIVVAFKGTTYTRFNEWIVDANFPAQRPPDPSQLWDAPVSRGVYSALFDNYTSLGTNPFDHIVGKIQALADGFNATPENPVPVYVTGHSLGASYSTLFYAEFVRRFGLTLSPFDRAARFKPVDLHNFGSPRVALKELGEAFNNYLKEAKVHAWRIANKLDKVTSVPPVHKLGRWQNFNHIDGGWHLGDGAPTPLPSELGTEPPYHEGNWKAHMPGPYYHGIKAAPFPA